MANEADVEILLDLQEKDGSFGNAWYVRYGSKKIRISHRGFGCVIAVVALQRLRQAMVDGGTWSGTHKRYDSVNGSAAFQNFYLPPSTTASADASRTNKLDVPPLRRAKTSAN